MRPSDAGTHSIVVRSKGKTYAIPVCEYSLPPYETHVMGLELGRILQGCMPLWKAATPRKTGDLSWSDVGADPARAQGKPEPAANGMRRVDTSRVAGDTVA